MTVDKKHLQEVNFACILRVQPFVSGGMANGEASLQKILIFGGYLFRMTSRFMPVRTEFVLRLRVVEIHY